MQYFFTLALAIVATPFTFANPEPQTGITTPPIVCTDVCRLTKPICPAGYAASGSDGCWGCCQPVCRRICPTVNSTTGALIPIDPPICLSQETLVAADSITGCWGCCKPACGTICASSKPIACPLNSAAVGTDGCWSCCPIVATL
ncbi:hypothetical protein CPC08DRAFT_345083 [Agrocybe pediades]|nr:hypothetical protein CPC08DRAFT_345083 [Agrocybe pediades]